MDLVRIGEYAINLDRLAWVKDEADSGESPVLLVCFGDSQLKLEGREAELLRAYVRQVSRKIEQSSAQEQYTNVSKDVPIEDG